MRLSLIDTIVFAGLAAASALPKRQGTDCASLQPPEVENATVTSLTGVESDGKCQVQLYLTHTGANDNVSIITLLPLTGWNGRFQGIGGGGFKAGGSIGQLSLPASEGYVAGTTDAGLPADSNATNFAFDDQLKKNFAYLSVHDMTVASKALAEEFYGTAVKYSYWNGCSTGGRQGYMEAQRFPEDYNGVYAASPPLDYAKFQVSRLWPYTVQNVEGEFVDQCIFTSLTQGAIIQCDLDDGGQDNLISFPTSCVFNAESMVGLPATACGDGAVVTDLQAEIFNKIAYGPVDTNGTWLYFGIAKGASYSVIAGSVPYPDAAGFTAAWALNDTNFDLTTLNYTSFPEIFYLAYKELDDLIGTDNTDLSPFAAAGGKLLSWHGWADPNIYANETADYWRRVNETVGETLDVHDFYRLYLAPGVGHCGGGTGATPIDPFDLLVAWVENGTAPEVLPSAGNNITRNTCLYPKELQYTSNGSIDVADSWTCV